MLDSVLSFCILKHPNECILILRGKSKKGDILINVLVILPFSFESHSYSGLPHYMLTAYMSYVETIHSHPSGNANSSVTDLNSFFELISLIVRFSYCDNDIFAWNSNDKGVKLTIIE